MDQQEMADQLEIQQLAARYMMLSARKDNDHWLDVFTPTACTTRSVRPTDSTTSRCS